MSADSRGTCGVCARVMQVRRDGTLRHHVSARGSSEACSGAGGTPLPTTSTDHYAVYRCFDSAGRLLYIGSTQALMDRMWVHATTKPELMDHLHCTEVAWYPSRQAASRAERKAIRAEAPLLNKRHNLGRGVDVVPAITERKAA